MRKTEQNKLTKTSAYHTYNAQQAGENGITLVSLVVTIIVLLILAGVGINMAINSDGLFAKAGEATEEWNTAVGQEETTINSLLDTLEEASQTLKPMITKWNIAAGDTISIYLYSPEDIIGNELSNNTDVTIDWGDGTAEHYTSSNLQYNEWGGYGYVEHTYTTANGNNIVTINGKCNSIDMESCLQLTSIEQWGFTETYGYYFGGCENLANIASPEKYTFKNATGFRGTFSGCTGITSIPDGLFANCSNATDFSGTFEDCTGITNIPDGLFANCSNATSFEGTFYGCTRLTSIGTHTFEGCTNATSFAGVFAGCTGITRIPDGLFANCSNATSFDGVFAGCASLTTIGAHVFDGCSSVTSFSGLFEQPAISGAKMDDKYTVEKCIVVSKEYEVMPVVSAGPAMLQNPNITSIGDYAFANCTAVTDFSSTFSGCTNLQSIPEHLFENTPNVENFNDTFAGCTSLSGNAIPLWERIPMPSGIGCYQDCTGLADYADIPTDWK